MYSVFNITKYIFMRCNYMGLLISNLKLQKILYFIQANFLVVKNQPCFTECIEAWDFGPVIPEIYKKYKIYGAASIPYIQRYEKDEELYFPKEDQKLIDEIINECAKYSAAQLTFITCNQKPWKHAYNFYCKNIISNESIKEYFRDK